MTGTFRRRGLVSARSSGASFCYLCYLIEDVMMNEMDGRWQGGFNHLLQKRSSSDIKDQLSTASLNFSITRDFRIVQLRSCGMAGMACACLEER